MRQWPAAPEATAAERLLDEILNRSCLSSLAMPATSSGFTDGSCLLSPHAHALISSNRRSEIAIVILQGVIDERPLYGSVTLSPSCAETAPLGVPSQYDVVEVAPVYPLCGAVKRVDPHDACICTCMPQWPSIRPGASGAPTRREIVVLPACAPRRSRNHRRRSKWHATAIADSHQSRLALAEIESPSST
jgi:hypothetical protein